MSIPTSTFNALGFSRYSTRGAASSFIRQCRGGNLESTCIQNYADASSGGSPAILPGSITTEYLADGAVTAAKIQDATITGDKIAPGVIPNGGGGTLVTRVLGGTIDFSSDASPSTYSISTYSPVPFAGFTVIGDSALTVAPGDFFRFTSLPQAPIAVFDTIVATVRSGITFLNPGNGQTTDRTFDLITVACRPIYIPDGATDTRFLLGTTSTQLTYFSIYSLGINISGGAFTGNREQAVAYNNSDSQHRDTFFMVPAAGKIYLAYKVFGSRVGWQGNAFSAGIIKPQLVYDKLTALSPAPTPYSFTPGLTIPIAVERTNDTTMTFQVTDWSSVPAHVDLVGCYLTVPEARMYSESVTPVVPTPVSISYGSTSAVTRTVTAGITYEAYYLPRLKSSTWGTAPPVYVAEIQVTVTTP
jgi:hypothetical protein